MKLIDKTAIVAEIERIKEDAGIGLDAYGMGEENGKLEVCDKLLSFIDSIETKEVDLDNELDFVKDAYYYFTSDERSSMKKVARHFFELGLKAREE